MCVWASFRIVVVGETQAASRIAEIAPRRHLALLVVLAVAMLPLLWAQMSREQRSRITALAEQTSAGERPTDDGYQLHQAKQRFDAGQMERTQEILQDLLPGEGGRDGLKHRFAWEYLWKRSRRSLGVLSRRNEQVTCIALTAEGELLITGDADGSVRLRDLRTGDLRATLRGHRFRVYRLVPSQDGNSLASAAWSDERAIGDEVIVWDLKHLRSQFRLNGPGDEGCHVLRFDESGGRLWCNGKLADGRPVLQSWDLRPDPSRPSLQWQRAMVPGIPITRDGSIAVVLQEGRQIQVVDTSTGRSLGMIGPLSSVDVKAALSPRGRLLAYHIRDTGQLRVLDLSAMREIRRFDDIHGVLWDLEFSPDERRLLSTNEWGELVVRDLVDGRVLRIAPETPEKAVHYAVFSPDSRRLASTYNGDASGAHPIKILELDHLEEVATYPGALDRVSDILFSPEGRSLLVRTTQAVVRWDIEPGPEPGQPSGHADEAWALSFSPDGGVLASGSDTTDEPSTIKLWDVPTGRLLRDWNAGPGTVSALAFHPSVRLLASGHLERADNVRLWDPVTGQQLGTLRGHTDRVRALAFSPDGKLLATTGSDLTVRVWGVDRRECVKLLSGHNDTVASLAFSPDGRRIASAGCDRTIRLWDLDSGSATRLTWAEKFSAVRFTPEGDSLVASDEDGRITVWDAASGSRVRTIDAEDRELRCLSLCPDGETIAAAGDASWRDCKQNPVYNAMRPDDPRDWNGVNTVVTPAWYDEYVLTVGAVDSAGAPMTKSSVAGPWVSIAAPGTDIEGLSPRDDGLMNAVDGPENSLLVPSGTSFSTAIVSGVVALVRAKYPELSAHQVINRILQTAHHPPRGVDNQVGYGMIDPVAALTFDVAPGDRVAPSAQSRIVVPPQGPAPRDHRARNIALGFAGAVAVGVLLSMLIIRARRSR